jgi:hypothetical protein
VLPEVLPVLEVEVVAPALLDGHGEQKAVLRCLAGDVGAELLVDEEPGGIARSSLLQRTAEPFVDDALRVDDRLGLFRSRVAGNAEHLLLERSAMVEGQDVEVSFVPERHAERPPCRMWTCTVSARRPGSAGGRACGSIVA